jgi:leucyl aminopeptidase
MADFAGAVVFFDIGNTLGQVMISASGDRVEKITGYPYIPGVLGTLRDGGARLGVISDRGPIPAEAVNDALVAAGLWFFEPELVRYGRKDSPGIFEHAASLTQAERLLFVGEDPGERVQALQAGFLVAPHPLLAGPVLAGASLRYLRVTAPPAHQDRAWRGALTDLAVLPVHVTGATGEIVYAIATTAAAAQLDDLGFWVDRLGAEDEPLTTDLYLLQDDRQAGSGFLSLDGNSTDFFETGPASRSLLASTPDGLVVALPGGSSVESFHFSGTVHGHNLKLLPFVTVPVGTPGPAGIRGVEAAVPTALDAASRGAMDLTAEELAILTAHLQPQHLREHVERYSGVRPTGPGGVEIRSRHIHHADNAKAVSALAEDLDRIGAGRLAVRRHPFTHESRPLDNVEAELAGDHLDGIILVTAHMDSTGARQPGYRPASDPAPGADDDASGTAGVLAAAAAICQLATLGVPHRTVRFVLFNAEEHGLVGSRAYARDQALSGTPIVAVLQMDMIGYDVLPGRTFELHAGIGHLPDVETRSLELARMIAGLVTRVSPDLPAPQIYPVEGEPDPAERRSDHYSFMLQGYPGCLASEDLFAGPGSGAPPEEMNPQYHLPTDATINAEYAADIARLVTAAAWVAATR